MVKTSHIKSFIYLTTVLYCFHGAAQSAYPEGKPPLSFNKILNYSGPAASFNEIKKDITIIDFFGTWCVPCIKALPHLKEMQQQFADRVRILLVSIEEEEKLKKFIVSRPGFSFPLSVDEDNSITNLFNPPSYPFTVVLDRDGRLLTSLTDAKELTPAAIEGWLAKKSFMNASNTPATLNKNAAAPRPLQKSTNSAILLSQEFIYAAKTGEALEKIQSSLANLEAASLKNALKNDAEKKAFWINIYNGYTNTILKKDPELYRKRNKFFGAKQIEVAGMKLSLDEIEHDFLRRTRVKWSLGYLGKVFPSPRAKEFRVEKLDYRIHFALNCGAKSCPPIAYYSPDQLDTQLEMATKNYLTSEVDYKKEENIIYLPAILSWFRADFGGKKGMKNILKKHGLLGTSENPKIRFKKYDWTLELNNYKTE